jgi:Flp pilus assembly protein TadD
VVSLRHAALLLLVTLAACQSGSATREQEKELAANRGDVLIRLGDTERVSGNCSAAQDFYEKALASHGDGVEGHIGLGECLMSAGSLDGAEREFRVALTLGPHQASPRFGLGRVYLQRGDAAAAVGLADDAVSAGEPTGQIYDMKGVALDLLGRHGEAQTAYRSGLALLPKDRGLRNNLALSLAMSGKLPEAVSMLRSLANEPSANTRTRQNLALVLGWSGDLKDARDVAAQDLKPEEVEANLRFYQALRQAGGLLPAGSQSSG